MSVCAQDTRCSFPHWHRPPECIWPIGAFWERGGRDRRNWLRCSSPPMTRKNPRPVSKPKLAVPQPHFWRRKPILPGRVGSTSPWRIFSKNRSSLKWVAHKESMEPPFPNHMSETPRTSREIIKSLLAPPQSRYRGQDRSSNQVRLRAMAFSTGSFSGRQVHLLRAES